MVIGDEGLDGPVAQVVFMNNDITKKYQQELENFIVGLTFNPPRREGASFDKTQPHPQTSAIVLEEDRKTLKSSDIKRRSAFTAVGNVQYYKNFCIDQLGKPLIDWNPQLTEGWEIPTYSQVFTDALPFDDDGSKPKKRSRPKATCWNCDSESHSLRECTQPRDLVKINQNRQVFMDSMGTSPRSGRYHKDDEAKERLSKFKPGVFSDTLREALNITQNQLPPFIYQMRIYGYPPGYLKEAEIETSGLTMYNHEGKATGEDGEALETGELHGEKKSLYNPEKIIEYPGFNVNPDPDVVDEHRQFNMPAMQLHQSKEVFKLYLSPASEQARKRHRSDDERTQPRKKQRIEADRQVAEMDISLTATSSDEEMDNGLVFKPPLPPDFAAATPPPLPSDTPPSTPGNTPRHMQSNTSDSENSASNSRCTTPELDELEEKQRLLLAALEEAEGTSTDTGGLDTMNEDDENNIIKDGDTVVIGDEEFITTDSYTDNSDNETVSSTINEEMSSNGRTAECENNDSTSEKGINMSVSMLDEQTSNKQDSTESDQDINNGTNSHSKTPSHSDSESKNGIQKSLKGIPDASKFASGISPYRAHDNETQSTGVFKKIRGIIKKIQKKGK
uniref:Zinc finger CCHC domain-containing protein 8-like n=1 Tax=Saccoglossus kowalevskii TaxID=10224 RepID=A0ABM0MSK8_SACKO|nr:PREDICTED: zinc finger CCHC domain-containing protein 8-like [Saccoglossus kowalevskii]